MDKICYYNSLVRIHPEEEANTENFLFGLSHHFAKIDLLYSFLRGICGSYAAATVVVFPSFDLDADPSSPESRMDRLTFRIAGEDNRRVCGSLAKKVARIRSRHCEASCAFAYDQDLDRIILDISGMELIREEKPSGSKNEYR